MSKANWVLIVLVAIATPLAQARATIPFAQAKTVAAHYVIPNGRSIRVFGPIRPDSAYTHAVCSWNIESDAPVQARFEYSVDQGKWRLLGTWPNATKDGGIRVSGSAHELRIRASFSNPDHATLALLAASFVGSEAEKESSPSRSPEKDEDESPGGLTLETPADDLTGASPTEAAALSVVRFWEKTIAAPGRPFDARSFLHAAGHQENVATIAALTGARLGFRSYQAIFSGLEDLEQGVGNSLPIICRLERQGRLIAVVPESFSSDGKIEAVIFDGASPKEENLTEAEFDREWKQTDRQVLLIQPAQLEVPGQEQGRPNRCWVILKHGRQSHYGQPEIVKPN